MSPAQRAWLTIPCPIPQWSCGQGWGTALLRQPGVPTALAQAPPARGSPHPLAEMAGSAAALLSRLGPSQPTPPPPRLPPDSTQGLPSDLKGRLTRPSRATAPRPRHTWPAGSSRGLSVVLNVTLQVYTEVMSCVSPLHTAALLAGSPEEGCPAGPCRQRAHARHRPARKGCGRPPPCSVLMMC